MNTIQHKLRGVAIFAAFAAIALNSMAGAQDNPYAEPEEPGLPPSNMVLDLPRTAIVITDPQIDFLSPDGATWGLVGKSVTANKTVEHIEQLLKTAKANDRPREIKHHDDFVHVEQRKCTSHECCSRRLLPGRRQRQVPTHLAARPDLQDAATTTLTGKPRHAFNSRNR